MMLVIRSFAPIKGSREFNSPAGTYCCSLPGLHTSICHCPFHDRLCWRNARGESFSPMSKTSNQIVIGHGGLESGQSGVGHLPTNHVLTGDTNSHKQGQQLTNNAEYFPIGLSSVPRMLRSPLTTLIRSFCPKSVGQQQLSTGK